MNFMTAVRMCHDKYATFGGRATRGEYWCWQLYLVFTYLWLTLFDKLIFDWTIWTPLTLIWSLFYLLPSLAVTVRRLHDTGRSGWWLLINFTIIGQLLILFWLIKKSEHDENRFGPNPMTA